MASLTDVTNSVGEQIKKFLQSDTVVQGLDFPCLSRRLKMNWAYTGQDYFEVAKLISPTKVGVYTSPKVETAQYFNKGDGKTGDFFVLNPSVANSISQYWSVVVHEATHMIQDYKKMKVSRQEMEMEAHFAQGLYRVKAKHKADKASSAALTAIQEHAAAYHNDKRYLKVFGFDLIRQKMMKAIVGGYGSKPDFLERKQLDGVIE